MDLRFRHAACVVLHCFVGRDDDRPANQGCDEGKGEAVRAVTKVRVFLAGEVCAVEDWCDGPGGAIVVAFADGWSGLVPKGVWSWAIDGARFARGAARDA